MLEFTFLIFKLKNITLDYTTFALKTGFSG